MIKKEYLKLLDKMSPVVRDAFVKAIQIVSSSVRLKDLEAALSDHDVNAILKLLRIDGSDLSIYSQEISKVFGLAGAATSELAMRQALAAGNNTVRGGFDIASPAATKFLSEQSAALVYEIKNHLVENVEKLLGELRAGVSPGAHRSVRTIALDLVGRINPATGRRSGGIIGLTPREAEWADNAYSQLVSGDPSELKKYMRRKLRDRRFDSLVESSIESGKPIPPTKASQMTDKYRNRLLKKRGERIARTEVIAAMNEARSQAADKLIADGILRPIDILLVWDATEDGDVRNSHSAMDGHQRPKGQPFITGLGNRLLYPGDRSSGAPAEDVINCRCFVHQRFDFIAAAQAGLG